MTWKSISALFVFGLAFLNSQGAGANEIIARMFWSQLQTYETDAIRDYTSNNISPDVLSLSDHLWSLSTDSVIDQRYDTCRSAARTLSMMVAGSYWSAKANEVSMDWHLYSKQYAADRSSCLKAINISERENSLPWWFGR